MSRHPAAIVGVCALTFLAGLGCPAVTDSDEAYYAQAAREMIDRGDWLTPHYNGEVRFEKPVLYYWLAAATYAVAGTSPAAARLPSALAGVGLALLAFACARRWYDEGTALLGGVITATAFGYVAMARHALPDLPLAFFVTLTTWGRHRGVASRAAWRGERIRPRRLGSSPPGPVPRAPSWSRDRSGSCCRPRIVVPVLGLDLVPRPAPPREPRGR